MSRPDTDAELDLDEIEINDRDDLIQVSRIREIQEERQYVNQVWTNLQNEVATNPQITDKIARRAFHRAIQSLLIQVEPLADRAPDYWEDYDLGTFTVTPPDGADADPRSYQIEGLRDILNLSPYYAETFEITRTAMGGRERTHTEQVTAVLSDEVLREALRAANHFLSDIGFEIDTEPLDEGHL